MSLYGARAAEGLVGGEGEWRGRWLDLAGWEGMEHKKEQTEVVTGQGTRGSSKMGRGNP